MTEGAVRGLLDTSTVVLLLELAEPEVLPREPLISAITLAELSVGPLWPPRYAAPATSLPPGPMTR